MLTARNTQASPGGGNYGKASEPDRSSVDPSVGFTVARDFDRGRMTLALRGELDLASAPLLEREIEALPWPELAELVFDLAEMTFIDSTGLSLVLRASQRAATAQIRFSVVRVGEQPRKLFTIARVTDRLNVQP